MHYNITLNMYNINVRSWVSINNIHIHIVIIIIIIDFMYTKSVVLFV